MGPIPKTKGCAIWPYGAWATTLTPRAHRPTNQSSKAAFSGLARRGPLHWSHVGHATHPTCGGVGQVVEVPVKDGRLHATLEDGALLGFCHVAQPTQATWALPLGREPRGPTQSPHVWSQPHTTVCRPSWHHATRAMPHTNHVGAPFGLTPHGLPHTHHAHHVVALLGLIPRGGHLAVHRQLHSQGLNGVYAKGVGHAGHHQLLRLL